MMIDYQLIGKRIAEQRKSKHITQESLAEYLDISTAYVSKIERGKTQLSLERLVEICHFLDLSPSVLIEGGDPTSASYMLPELSELLDQCPKELLPLIKSIIEDVVRFYKGKI